MTALSKRTGSVLDVAGLTISFTDCPLFNPLSFSVHPGEILALIGPSGVGKTSILPAICGLFPAGNFTGTVWRNEAPSIVYQDDRLLPWCDLLSNSLIPVELQRVLNGQDVVTARALLAEMGLSSFERSLPAEVSG